jgi:hypothetical protein
MMCYAMKTRVVVMNVAKRFPRESNLMESYYTSIEFANVVTPSFTCEVALMARGIHDTIIDSGATCHTINDISYA